MTPWLSDPDVTLYHGDVLETLRGLPAESVDCVVTSPPYWGLRDYGTGAWEGGDAECDHKQRDARGDSGRVSTDDRHGNINPAPVDTPIQYRDICGKCGATRIDQQLGLEPTPEQYVERMVEVFREIRRVLAAHGTVWLNLGDSYASSPKGNPEALSSGLTNQGRNAQKANSHRTRSTVVGDLKPKDLVGIPWRVAFALQADGWYLRSDIIWAKPNPMPESVTDRPTKAHEYVFMLSKQPRYFFDQEAVREASVPSSFAHGLRYGEMESIAPKGNPHRGDKGGAVRGKHCGVAPGRPQRNIRSVWEIATQPYPEAHFATFPEELARRCIAAGTSERGVCPECGSPWVREVSGKPSVAQRKNYAGRGHVPVHRGGGDRPGGYYPEIPKTLGWRHGCRPGCVTGGYTWKPATVLDPFMGSGTVAFVARKLGRRSIGIDLSAEYLALAARRLQQQSLFAEIV